MITHCTVYEQSLVSEIMIVAHALGRTKSAC